MVVRYSLGRAQFYCADHKDYIMIDVKLLNSMGKRRVLWTPFLWYLRVVYSLVKEKAMIANQ